MLCVDLFNQKKKSNTVTSHCLLVRVLLFRTIWGKHPVFMLIQIDINNKLIVDFGGRLPYMLR